MNKIRKHIEMWEMSFRDEFGSKLFKTKGTPNKVVSDLDNFLNEKGLLFGRRKHKRK